jgi:glycerophosphoryl diester phosphodiesterase
MIARPPLVLAHRGACRIAPENTIEAFAAARRVGADGVELDVHRSRDGELVVHHDAEAPGLGLLAAHELAAIRRALPLVPTLHEALDACQEMLVNIEIKNLPGDADFDPRHRVADAVAAVIGERRLHDRTIVSSFNLDSIDRVRAREDRIATAWLTYVGLDPLDALRIARDHGHRALHPDRRVLDGDAADRVVVRAHELGLQVTTWTVDDPDRIRTLAAADIDGVITNDPVGALRALGRGPAPPG